MNIKTRNIVNWFVLAAASLLFVFNLIHEDFVLMVVALILIAVPAHTLWEGRKQNLK
ncbi:MAG: hypothetical protein WCT49_03720 [Candidatus Paceibacterota bacterium]|jgi:hypothetical protein|nr:hypothetical protein [Candidatus Paceibacterota bacterium]